VRLVTRERGEAVPELDGLGSEEKRACVRGVGASWRWRVVRWVVLGVMAVVVVGVGVGLGLWASDAAWRRRWLGEIAANLVGAGVFLAVVTPGLVGVLVVADRLRARRVRRAMRDRALCQACGYSLVRAVVDEGGRVRCSECGGTEEVEAGSVVSGEGGAGGARVYEPRAYRERGLRAGRRRRRHRVFVRAVAVTTAAVVVGGAGAYGAWWLWLERQAERARALRAGQPELRAHLAGVEARLGTSVADRDELVATMEEVQGVVLKVAEGQSGARRYSVDFLSLTPEWGTKAVVDARQGEGFYDGTVRLAERALFVLERRGTLGRVDRLGGLEPAGPSVSFDEDEPVPGGLFESLGGTRQIARLSAARMERSLAAGDRETYVRALEAGLMVARWGEGTGLVVSRLVGNAVDAVILARVEAHAGWYPDGGWVAAVGEVLERRLARGPLSKALEGDRLLTVDSARWVYERAERARWAVLTGELGEDLGVMDGWRWLWGLGAAERAIDGVYGPMIAHAERVEGGAVGLAAPTVGQPDEALAGALMGSMVGSVWRTEAERERVVGRVRLRVALERVWFERGGYVGTGEGLEGLVAAGLLKEPWTGTELEVRVIDDPEGRGGKRPVIAAKVVGVPAAEEEK
jgi:hypothetical protein